MAYYEPVKITIDVPGPAEVIIDVVIYYHGLLNSIVTDKGSLFTSKFWSLLCYFFDIKKRLFTTYIYKQIARPKGRIVPWKPIWQRLSTSNKMTRLDSCKWPSLPIIIPKTQALVTRFLSWIVDIILRCLIRKTSTSTLNLSWWMNCQQNYKNWWLFVEKTYTTLKNFRSKLMINALSLKAMPQVIKFGWIANISKPNKTRS